MTIPNATQRYKQDCEAAAGARMRAQLGPVQPRPWRRKPLRGIASAIFAVIALAEIPVQLAGRHYGPAIGAAVGFVLLVLAARRRLFPPRRDGSS